MQQVPCMAKIQRKTPRNIERYYLEAALKLMFRGSSSREPPISQLLQRQGTPDLHRMREKRGQKPVVCNLVCSENQKTPDDVAEHRKVLL